MPTVISAFRAVRQEGLVVLHGSAWQLSADLPWSSVRRLAEAYAAERRLLRFTDPYGLANGVDALLASRVNLTQASRIAKLGLLSSLNINIEAFEATGRRFRMEVVKQLSELAA